MIELEDGGGNGELRAAGEQYRCQWALSEPRAPATGFFDFCKFICSLWCESALSPGPSGPPANEYK